VGVASGEELIKKFGGLRQAMKAIDLFAKRNNMSLGKLLGRKEALNLMFAANGAQAETYAEKLAAMNNVNGLAEEAFKEQAEGANRAGHSFKVLTQRVSVMGQKFGDVIGEALIPFFDKLAPILTMLGNLSPGTKKVIVVLSALAAVVGPLIVLLGGLAIAITAVSWPVLAVVAGIALLASGVAIAIIKWKEWGKWIKAIGALILLLMGPIGWLIGAIILIGKNWDKIIGKIQSGIKVISKAFDKVKGFFGDGSTAGEQGLARINAARGLSPNVIGGAVRNTQTTQTNNAEVKVDFSGMPSGVKVKKKDPSKILNMANGLMTAGN
ncbi:MAG: hypothetical protein R3209_11915, partial [Salinimicrobium sediminis]|nr:hypothetical protein [Salinimicrobium sediminis]